MRSARARARSVRRAGAARALAVAALIAAGGCGRVAGGEADGAAVYDEACARCHGTHGVPDDAQVVRLGVKDLTDPELQQRLTDDAIAHQIRAGSNNQQMPAFDGVLSPEQVDSVIRHVRTLRRH
jgi:mono/diheme cytochrome c family protein